MSKKSALCYILILAFACIGLLMALNLLVPIYTVQRSSLWGDPSGDPGLVLFTLKSKGTLTANYPVEVEIKILVGKDIEGYFQAPAEIKLIIPDSYQYPIVQSPEGFFSAGEIPISAENRRGSGTIIFPYSGSFSAYHIFVNVEPVWTANFPVQNEPSIFTIEDYSIRLQIENDNRNIGIAIMSLSITAIALIFSVLRKSTP